MHAKYGVDILKQLRTIFLFFSELLILCCLCGCMIQKSIAQAQTDAGLEHYARGYISKAFKAFQSAAEKGNNTAQIKLGHMYANGTATVQDEEEGLKWFRIAAKQGNNRAKRFVDVLEKYLELKIKAEQGDISAQNSLGEIYYFGKNAADPEFFEPPVIARDHKKATKWFELAAHQGHADAQFRLATIFGHEDKSFEDKEVAFHWCSLAADQGNAEAQYLLGNLYLDGVGTTKDYDQAVKWFKLVCCP